jgi:hypothetical protein
LQWSKGEIRIQSSGSSTQITTTSRCSGEIAEASVSKGITNLGIEWHAPIDQSVFKFF